MEAKRRKVGKKRCSCVKVGFPCLASCLLDKHCRKRTWQNSNVFYNKRTWRRSGHVDVRKEKKKRTHGEHFSEPTSMSGRVLLSRKHRREANTFCTCFAKARNSTQGTWHAGGVELRSRVDSRHLRTLPLASDAVALILHISAGTSRKGSRTRMRHRLARPNIAMSRNSDEVVFAQTGARAKKQPSCVWPERFAAICIFGRIGISREFLQLLSYFCVRDVFVLVVVFVCSCARLRSCFCFCIFVRAHLYFAFL